MEASRGPWYTAGPYGMAIMSPDPYGHGEMHIGDVRGWGHLTGAGACRFDEKKAIAIQEANARLIAAAPALLQACRTLVAYCSRRDGTIGTYEEWMECFCEDGSTIGEVVELATKAIAMVEEGAS